MDHIATLEVELFTLKTKKANTAPAARTRAQTQAQKSKITIIEEEDEAEVAAARATKSSIKEVIKEPVTRTTTTATVLVPQPVITQEHPFHNAKDAAYVPSANKNPSTTASTPTILKRPEAAYKTLPPIHNPNIAAEVYKQSMEAPITITQCELLSLSSEVRSQVRDATTTKQVPNKLPRLCCLPMTMTRKNNPQSYLLFQHLPFQTSIIILCQQTLLLSLMNSSSTTSHSSQDKLQIWIVLW